MPQCLFFIQFNRFKPIVQFSISSIHFLLNLLQAVRTSSCISEGMPTLFRYFKHSGPAAEDSKVLPKPDGPLASLVPSYSFCRQKISRMITSAKFIQVSRNPYSGTIREIFCPRKFLAIRYIILILILILRIIIGNGRDGGGACNLFQLSSY